MSADARYFVLNLGRDDYRPFPEAAYVIQRLDEEGTEVGCVYLIGSEETVAIDGETVPALVFSAAKRQPIGVGDYVNDSGESVAAF